jgi:D-aminoacyl-tRNA deacylase
VIGVVVSRADEASVHVGERLLELADWVAFEDPDRPDGEGGGTCYRRDGFELREFDDLHLYLEGVADAFGRADGTTGDRGGPAADGLEFELVVFVSRHSGETGPLLSAHFTGNVGPADFGGRPDELARACPNALAAVLESLSRHAPDGYDVAMECTHHGPTAVGAPSMFVEVGSAEPQWRDAEAAGAVARAVFDLAGIAPDRERTVVGLGGGHYAPRFTRIVRETDWAVGHVLPDWALDAADELPRGVIASAFERSGATRAVVDGDRPELVAAVEAGGYRVVGETWVRETTGVPLDLVERAESALRTVEDGLRFGDERAGALDVHSLNPDLVGVALGVDAEATRRAFQRHAVAYVTEESGNRPTGRVALAEGASLDSLVDSLATVIEGSGASVERDGDDLVVVESAFDPAKAREHGVPEGPAFGRLAAGEPVEVDGATVTPESVHGERTRRYSIRAERP